MLGRVVHRPIKCAVHLIEQNRGGSQGFGVEQQTRGGLGECGRRLLHGHDATGIEKQLRQHAHDLHAAVAMDLNDAIARNCQHDLVAGTGANSAERGQAGDN